MNAEQLAKAFHERYERTALELGYSTRPESRTSWENVPELNRRVMIKTCESILSLMGFEADIEAMDAAGLAPDAKPWYCPTCRIGVDGEDVTHDERHDPRAGGCGDHVRARLKPLDLIDGRGGAERIFEEQAAAREKGFDAEHDDQHAAGQLALAAIAYAAPVRVYVRRDDATGVRFEDPFPWPGEGSDARFRRGERRENPGNVPPDPKTYRPNERVELLVKAGGFIASEIDRIIRAEGGPERFDEKMFACPSRAQGPFKQGALDVWRGDRWSKPEDKWSHDWKPRTCSFCGGVHPEDALRLIDEGWEIERARGKPHKAYLHPAGYTAAMRATLKGVQERGVDGLAFPEGYVDPVPPVKLYGPHFTPEQLANLNTAIDRQREEKGRIE